jgi:hypothetical protein
MPQATKDIREILGEEIKDFPYERFRVLYEYRGIQTTRISGVKVCCGGQDHEVVIYTSRYLPEVGQIKEKIFRRIKKAFLDVIERPEDYVAYLDYNPTHTRDMVEQDEDAFYSPIRKKGYITELSMRGKILKELFFAGYLFKGNSNDL